MKFKFKKFSSKARISEKQTSGSACFDAFSARSVTLERGVTSTVQTDIGRKFSKNYVFRLYPRSGLSCKSVILGGGVIDSNFLGNIFVILTNLSKKRLKLKLEIE